MIGWTAAQTLDHTPEEIRLAKKGRVDMINSVIRAVFPSKGPDAPAKVIEHKLRPTAANLRMVFQSLAGDRPL